MQIRVLPLPDLRAEPRDAVFVVVDVIRATTFLVMLFEAGCNRILLSRERLDAAKVRAAAGADSVLFAEGNDGTAPAGFDFEPSPALLQGLDLRGKTAVLATANGVPAAVSVANGGASLVALASLRNLAAASARALDEAMRRRVGITIVCSGRLRNAQIALEDIYCAGAMVDRLGALAAGAGTALTIDDSAAMAAKVFASTRETREAMLESMTGRRFVELGRADDVLLCSVMDAVDLTPVVVGSGAAAAYPVEILDEHP